MLHERREWIRVRFGNISDDILGQIQQVEEITWPNLEREYTTDAGKKLRFKLLGKDIKPSSERIAEIYQNGIDEMIGNSEYEWHHDPAAIIERGQRGDWNFIVCHYDDQIISAGSFHIIRGQRAIQWVWGCVDPAYRGISVWKYAPQFADEVVELSGAQMGILWVVTTHPYSQMAVESVGYKPIGCFVGGEFFGGSDGKYYRQSVIWYAKHYHDSSRHIPAWEDMKLFGQGKQMVEAVKKIWQRAPDDLESS